MIAVELREPRGYGRARMSIIPNAEAKTLRKFLITTVEPGSTVVTDGWGAYPKACQDWFGHEPYPVAGSGMQASELLPANPRARLQRLLDFAPGQPLRDLPDPYYGGPPDFERVIDLCEQASRGLLQHLQSAADDGRGQRA